MIFHRVEIYLLKMRPETRGEVRWDGGGGGGGGGTWLVNLRRVRRRVLGSSFMEVAPVKHGGREMRFIVT